MQYSDSHMAIGLGFVGKIEKDSIWVLPGILKILSPPKILSDN